MFKNINTQKVAHEVFLRPTEERSIRDIAKLTKLSPATVSKICKELEEQKITLSRQIAKSKLIRAFLESAEYKFYKRLANIESLKWVLDDLVKHKPLAIILYGSYSKGDDTESSDIDLAIIGTEFKLPLDKYEKQLNRKLHLMFFTSESKIPSNLKSNIQNGTVLSGALL
jgi:predicted nucleotidyltransferase